MPLVPLTGVAAHVHPGSFTPAIRRSGSLWSTFGPVYLTESTSYTVGLPSITVAERTAPLPSGGAGYVSVEVDVRGGWRPVLESAGAAGIMAGI
jgi:hypothetical protein